MRSARVLIAALSISFAIAFPGLAASDESSSSDASAGAVGAATALENVPGVLDASASVQTTSTANSALVAAVQGGTIKVPDDPSSGVSIATSDGVDISVAIPGAENAINAQAIVNDAVVYTNVAPGASIVAQATPAVADTSDLIPAVGGSPDTATSDTTADQGSDQSASSSEDATINDDTGTIVDENTTDSSDAADADTSSDIAPAPDSTSTSAATPLTIGGGVRLMVIINGADAPSSYEFPLSIPEGRSISSTADGGYQILNSDGSAAITILPPWARDANDNLIPSSYSLNGTILTLRVDLSGATFPVVADPSLLTDGRVALPFADIPDSATLTGDTIVAGSIPTSGETSELGGVVYALAWPSASTTDTTPELSLSHQPIPVAQGRVGSDGSFTLRVPPNTNLSQFEDSSSGSATFDLYATVDGRSYYTVFSRNLSDPNAPAPDVSLSFSVPAVNSTEYSAVSVSNATMAAASTFSASTASDSCAKHPKRVNRVYIYICDDKGHSIKAPAALTTTVAYELNHLSPVCAEDGCTYDLNVGSPKPVWATVGQTFISGTPTAAHRYIHARFSFANSANATLGVGISGSAFIGGFHIGGTRGITNTKEIAWKWSPDQNKRSYQRRAYYQLREHWYAEFDPQANMVILTNTQNEYWPVAFEEIGSRLSTPSAYPKANVCEPVMSPSTEEVLTRNSHAFATLDNGVSFLVSSPFDDKYGPVQVSLTLSSQSGADSWVVTQYAVKDNSWICGNETDVSVEPFDGPKIRAIHGKKLPSGAVEWQPQQYYYN